MSMTAPAAKAEPASALRKTLSADDDSSSRQTLLEALQRNARQFDKERAELDNRIAALRAELAAAHAGTQSAMVRADQFADDAKQFMDKYREEKRNSEDLRKKEEAAQAELSRTRKELDALRAQVEHLRQGDVEQVFAQLKAELESERARVAQSRFLETRFLARLHGLARSPKSADVIKEDILQALRSIGYEF